MLKNFENLEFCGKLIDWYNSFKIFLNYKDVGNFVIALIKFTIILK